jgi:hypothetical protein
LDRFRIASNDTEGPSASTQPIENALLVMRWQSTQWQVYTICGAWVIS